MTSNKAELMVKAILAATEQKIVEAWQIEDAYAATQASEQHKRDAVVGEAVSNVDAAFYRGVEEGLRRMRNAATKVVKE